MEIILQKDESTTYKMVGQCGDSRQRLVRKSRGQSRLEGSCVEAKAREGAMT